MRRRDRVVPLLVGLCAWLAIAGGLLFTHGVDREGPLAGIGLALVVVALAALFVAGGLGLLD